MATKRTSWRTLKAGDAFSIPLADGRFGIGIVLIDVQEMYLSAYRVALDEAVLPQDPDALGPLWLVMWSMDEQFFRGRWKVVGRLPVPPHPRPKHVVNGPDGLVLCDFERAVQRSATEDVDLPFFGYRKSVSNIAFRHALECVHGIGNPGYDYQRLEVGLAWERERRE